MGQLTIPNTSVQYNNPKQIDQSTVVFPDCGDLASPQVAQVNPKTGLPAGPVTRTGRVWQPAPVESQTNATYGVPLLFHGPACPQPNSFDATPPKANPVLFGKQPTSLSDGGIQIPNSSCTVKNPA